MNSPFDLIFWDDTIVTVMAGNPYETWSVGATFDADDSRDGVTNGLAWLLGAGNTSDLAIDRLPRAKEISGKLVLGFTALKTAARGGVVLKIQHSRDLGRSDMWANHEAVVPDVSSTINGISFEIIDLGNLIDVKATIPASAVAPGTTLFGRLNAENAP